ncbi:NAD(P)-dependent oxidoreductase [Streptomyces sp. NPDC017979]|uniref:NAD(P)-dependent oxidoreductase n=1 Tax=Streptomyces sp. NPDC017979 TaxID=3365024 RepID=UPI00379BB950
MNRDNTPSTGSTTDRATTVRPDAVTVIGLGGMGRALAGAFLDAGHPTTVWNRTPGKEGDLVERGAVVAASAEEAVRASGLTLVCLLDYDASDAVLEPLADALAGRTLVNVTSDVPERCRRTAAWAEQHGIAYLDGAVMVPVPVVGTEHGLLFHAGPRDVFERHEDTLRALGGRTEYVGVDHGRAAAFDLALLDFFYGAISGMIHAFGMAKEEGVDAVDVAPYMATIAAILPPMLPVHAAEVDTRTYGTGGGGLGMMATAVDHVAHLARSHKLDSAQIDAIKRTADRAKELGHGDHTWAATYEALLSPRP